MDFAHVVKLNVFSSGACVTYIYCSLLEDINTYKKLHSSHYYGAHGEPTVFAFITGCVKGGDVMLCFCWLHSTILSERIQADTTGKNLTARTSSMVRERIAIPVLPQGGLYISEGARSCVTDCYFILLTFANWKISIRIKIRYGHCD